MSDDVLSEKNYISQLIYTLNNGADVALPNSGNIINNRFIKNEQNHDFTNLLYQMFLQISVGLQENRLLVRDYLQKNLN